MVTLKITVYDYVPNISLLQPNGYLEYDPK